MKQLLQQENRSRLEIDMGTFDAAHQLPHHHGKCQNLHGHTYRVKIVVEGDIQISDGSSKGMVVDFSILKAIYKTQIHDVVDHSFMLGYQIPTWYSYLDNKVDRGEAIGKVAFLPIPTTTAEWLAQWMFEVMVTGMFHFPETRACRLISVQVFETPTASALAVRYDK